MIFESIFLISTYSSGSDVPDPLARIEMIWMFPVVAICGMGVAVGPIGVGVIGVSVGVGVFSGLTTMGKKI